MADHARFERPARWEIVGAWLHVWTPPRGTAVPPVPWRWLTAAAVGLALLGVLVVTVVAPAIDRAKRRTAAAEARTAAENRAAERVRLRHDQRATVVRLRRGAIAPQVEAAVDRSARARVHSGELRAPNQILRTTCKGPARAPAGRLSYSCLAATTVSTGPRVLTVGFPFVAVVSADRRSLAWCKENPFAGEGMAFRQVSVPLPRVCQD